MLAEEKSVYDKNNPFPAKLTVRRLLNGEGSAKETYHYEVDLAGSGLTYTCGDSLGVVPRNDEDYVAELLSVLGCAADEEIEIPRTDIKMSLGDALTRYFALAGPAKKFLKTLSEKVTSSEEKERLHELLTGDTAVLKQYLSEREFIDLLEEYPSASFTAQEFVAELRKLMPRLYSIASSPLPYPESIHLTVATVRYRTNGRNRQGVASTFLSDRCPLQESALPVYVASSHFTLPEDPSTDMIMVGPGTGIAPFRSFVQEQIARQGTGRSWVFFGDQHRATDYLYEEEWEAYVSAGQVAKLDLAFSRDQEQKVYVQDKMRESGAGLWQWLQAGASFFICGDASRMAKDVDDALHQIVERHGDMSAQEAADYVKQLRKDKRYQKDVY